MYCRLGIGERGWLIVDVQWHKGNSSPPLPPFTINSPSTPALDVMSRMQTRESGRTQWDVRWWEPWRGRTWCSGYVYRAIHVYGILCSYSQLMLQNWSANRWSLRVNDSFPMHAKSLSWKNESVTTNTHTHTLVIYSYNLCIFTQGTNIFYASTAYLVFCKEK